MWQEAVRCAGCILLQPKERLDMEQQRQTAQTALESFEQKAEDLVSVMLALTEERFFAAPRCSSPMSRTQASAALAVKHSLDAFMAIAKLEG